METINIEMLFDINNRTNNWNIYLNENGPGPLYPYIAPHEKQNQQFVSTSKSKFNWHMK